MMNIADINRALGITDDMITRKKIQRFYEPESIVPVEGKIAGKAYMLEPNAATNWSLMKTHAFNEGILIYTISAFRSCLCQAEIIKRKLEKGIDIEKILEMSAPPGFSEHHSGRAIDIGTPGFADLEECFEYSAAYHWLEKNASHYGFHMSFPRGNIQGYGYEPWHWLHKI